MLTNNQVTNKYRHLTGKTLYAFLLSEKFILVILLPLSNQITNNEIIINSKNVDGKLNNVTRHKYVGSKATIIATPQIVRL